MNSGRPRGLLVHDRAREDLVEIYTYLSPRNERAAHRFLIQVRERFDLISRMPATGRRWTSHFPALGKLRVTAVSRRFRDYLIFYRVGKDEIEIATVVHGARYLSPLIESLPLADDFEIG